ncbi:ATP-binding protein [Trinickia sp.]|uniref:ATP-binding protein n=1 Tax=Trinickia sp. TaxID=2571163 RepID=UPI003F81565C
MNDFANMHVSPPYEDNAAFLADLHAFVACLLDEGSRDPDVDPSVSPLHSNASSLWRAIASRMAVTVRAEIFIPLAHVALVFRLDARDLQLLALALLSETDASIGDALAWLTRDIEGQDDAGDGTRARALSSEQVSLKTATHLLGEIRTRLFADGPLLANHLIELVGANVPTLQGRYRLGPSITAYLLGLAAPQARIGDYVAVDVPDDDLHELLADENVKRQSLRFVDLCSVPDTPFGAVVLQVEAEDATLAGAVAAAAFSKLGYGVTQLSAQHLRWTHQSDDQRLTGMLRQLRLACRDAMLCTQVIMLTDVDALIGNEEREQIDLFDGVLRLLLEAANYLVVLNGPARRLADAVAKESRQGARLFQLRVASPSAELRLRAWRKHAARWALPADDALLTAVAGAYALTEERIAAVAGAAAGRCALNGHDSIESVVWDACRTEAEEKPSGGAKRVDTPYRLDDLVAPERTRDLLTEALAQVRYRPRVIDEWGFAAKHANVTNLCVLFHGPPGTGKTMAASIVANELSLPMYRVDVSMVLSKYIGETEKNLAQLFDWAESMNVVLFLDECESLFSKRTETKDSHDRFANMQVGFLLQRIESYSGLVILATNLMGNMDKAFMRRFRFIIEFPAPTSEERLRLWRHIFPEKVRLHADVDFELLAEKASISGGYIRNAAISAAFLAAQDGGTVKMAHLVKAVAREYEKLGRLFSEADFGWHRSAG